MGSLWRRLRGVLDTKLLKFMLVGGINTLVGSAIMFGLYNLAGASFWLSSAANYVFTSILSFFLNKHFTFRSRGRSLREVLRFVLNIAACYVLAYGIAQPLVYRIMSAASQTVRDHVAMLVGMGLFMVLNYLSQRFFVFAQKKDE